MPVSQASFSALLASVLIPGVLREAGVNDAKDVEQFFRSRVCSQLCDRETGMWQLGCPTLAHAWKLERDGIDYQQPKVMV